MIILGIDPGTASTGYGIVKTLSGKKTFNISNKSEKTRDFQCLDYGVIQTDSNSNSGERLKKINNELSRIVKKYKPEVLAFESLYFFKNLKTAIRVSQAGGVILLMAARKKLLVREFTPLQVKLAITGNGWADKKEVQKKVKKIFNLKEAIKSDDAADALAIALTYLVKIA